MIAVARVRRRLVAVGEATDLLRVRRQRSRVDSLTVAVRENTDLAIALEGVVAGIERDLVPLLEERPEITPA